MTQALYELSLAQLASFIASGDLTPSDLLESVLERMAAVEDTVHAFSFVDVDAARSAAGRLTDEAASGDIRGPLHGIPFGVKDEFFVEGMPTRMRGEDVTAPEPVDATCVALLRTAGGIILGKTYMPVGGEHPPTRNPYNPAHTPGGTSSGSGAAVAARVVPAAIGEQTMGSNLRPAAYNGVAGLKPTYGRISRFGCLPFAWSVDTVGLIAVTMADLALVLAAIAGPDPLDPTALTMSPPPGDLKMEEFGPPRIGVLRGAFLDRTTPVVEQAMAAALERFRSAGAEVREVRLPAEFDHVWDVHKIVTAAEGATFYAPQHPEHELRGSSGRAGSLIPATYYLHARRVRQWLRRLVAAEIGDLDAIALPTTPAPAPLVDAGTGDATFLHPWSCLGFPAANLPIGLSPEGLPLGMQLVTIPGGDYGLLRTGAWCEAVIGRLPPPSLASSS